MPTPLPRLLPSTIALHVGDRSAAHGLSAQREGHVTRLRWDPATGRVTATVNGRQVQAVIGEYAEEAVSRRFMKPAPGGVWRPLSSRCTCEHGESCEHVAAMLYDVNHRSERAQANAPRSEWRTVLRPLLTTPQADESPRPLAIRFDLEAAAVHSSTSRHQREAATLEHLDTGADLWLGIRPMTRSRTGSWVKGSLSWRTFEYRMNDREYRPAHAEALTRIFAAAAAERSYTSGSIEHFWLNSIGSPLIWQSLAHAHEVGVEFLPGTSLSAITLADDAYVELDLRTAPSPQDPDLDAEAAGAAPAEADLALRPVVRIGGDEATQARGLGAAGVIDVREGQEGLTARIAPVGSPLPTTLRRLLQRPEPLLVPASDREDFFASALPSLRAITPVTSGDGSIELPAPKPPSLRVRAEFTSGDRLTLTWAWRYHEPPRTLPIDRRDGEGRDWDAEDTALEMARELWPSAGSPVPEQLEGAETARFAQHVLDPLRALPRVEVEIIGTRHDYRELAGAPEVRVSQHASPGKRDWFDLGFEITIDGTQIPFPSLFVALAQGRSKLLLQDRTYFSLDHPAFDALREVIRDGEALSEWEPERQQISRFQVDLWEDLEQIAIDAATSAAWDSGVGALRELTEIVPPPLPAGLTADLRTYQREGFAWLAFLFEHQLGGILADDMGLGKTVQTLALIAHAREQAASADNTAPFLVVAPASVLSVWRQEAERFTPGLQVRVLDRTGRSRAGSLAEEITGADLVITSYTVLRMDEEDFAEQQFQGLVLDEAQFVKNRRSRTHRAVKHVPAPFRMAITGTPMENSLDDLWSIFDLVAPGLLGSSIGFRRRYTMPIESGEHPERMELLRSRVRPFLLRRTKAVVAKELPDKQEQIVSVTLGPDHRALYDSVLQRERKKVLGLIETDLDRSRFIVFRSLTLLRMMALDPTIVDPEQYADVPGTKLEALFDRLEEALGENHRVLLFSQFTSYLQRVASGLESRGVAYTYLDGSTRDRDAVVTQFRQGDAPVFLISLKAGGFGLTLTEADYVFLLDPWWNPAAENQAVDRTHRIGQERSVMVYRMIAKDTVEEKVLALQRRKAELFDALTDGGEAFRSAITADDIRELLS